MKRFPTLPEEKNVFKKIDLFQPKTPPAMVSTKNFSQFGPAVWPAIGNNNVYECLILLYRRRYTCNPFLLKKTAVILILHNRILKKIFCRGSDRCRAQ